MTPVSSGIGTPNKIEPALQPPYEPGVEGAGDQRTELLRKVQEISKRLFPGPVTFEHAVDPEDPSNECTVFDVTAKGGFADYQDRIFKWHDEVERIVGSAVNEFRVIVHPLE